MGVFHGEDGRHVITDLMYVHSEFSIPQKDIPTMETTELLNKVSDVAEDMAGQMERNLFKTLTESIEESGNIIPGNPKLSPESVLTALEMVSIDFEDDDRSKPIRPSLIASPVAVEELMKIDAETTPEEKEKYRKKEQAIMDKKYEEHMKDLESRKIID
jgi:hypothetical protein